jgi:putative ATP-dependent endonuclease of OLD family
MKLRRVSIRNFRNLREVDISPMKTTVIIGENDTGKSNLLYALRLLLDPQAERLRLDLSEDDINDAAQAEGKTHFSVTVEIGDLQKHQDMEVCFKERIDRDNDETFVTIMGKFEPDDDGIYVWQSLVLSPQGRFNDPIPVSRRMARAIPLYFLDAVRDAAHDTRATGRGLLSRLLDNVDYTDVQNEVQGHLRAANNALNKGVEISSLAGGLTNELTSLVPGGQSDVVIAVADEDVSHLIRNFRLNIRRGPDFPQYDILRHGTGLQDLTLMFCPNGSESF